MYPWHVKKEEKEVAKDFYWKGVPKEEAKSKSWPILLPDENGMPSFNSEYNVPFCSKCDTQLENNMQGQILPCENCKV